MKKTVSLILSLTFVLMALTACAPSPNPAMPDGQNQPAATPATPATDAPTQAPEAGTENPTVVPGQQEAAVPQQQNNAQQTPAPSNLIGEEKAKEIALNRAGITAEGVFFDRVELDRDGGVWQYEVEFRRGLTEYDADIKADDGTILKFEMDQED